MNANPEFNHRTSDIPEAVIRDFAASFRRVAQEAFARPETQERYLLWRKAQFEMGNPLGLTPTPEDS